MGRRKKIDPKKPLKFEIQIEGDNADCVIAILRSLANQLDEGAIEAVAKTDAGYGVLKTVLINV